MVHIDSHSVYASKRHNMGSPEYTKLKQFITLKVGMSGSETHSQIIQAMKGLYHNGINSTRKFEQIKTIGQLLKVLETRDLLSEENILPLKVLAQQLPNDNDLMRNIMEYEKSYVPMPQVNQYAVQPQHVITSKKDPSPHNGGQCSSFMDGISETKRQRIRETITEEIGTYWRNLARYLGIREYKIDEIQCEYTTVSEKAAKILQMYETKADRQKWFFDLLEALEKAHRRDLSNELKKIATMNI